MNFLKEFILYKLAYQELFNLWIVIIDFVSNQTEMTLCSFFCKDVENELDLETENMNFFVNKRNSTDRAKSRFGSADGCIGRI